jgi:hypothetical protein
MRRIVLVLVATATASAQPAEVTAKSHYTRGKQLSEARDYTHAYDEFSAGYELTHRAPFLFDMAECERALHDPTRARELYQRYLTESPNGDLAPTARTRLAELGGAPVVPVMPAPLPVLAMPLPQQAALHVTLRPIESPSLIHRPAFWIGVGATLLAGSVAIYAVTRHGEPACMPPGCVPL